MSLDLQRVRVPGRLEAVDLSVQPGHVTAIVGRNGAGKSTLLGAALGLLPCEGSVHVDGTAIDTLSPLQRAERVAWLPQDPAPTEGLSVLEVVEAARYRFAESRSEAREAARRALDELDIGAFADRDLHTLSGGERQRVRMAALAAQQARYWMLDEPGNHLDPAAQLDAWSRLGQAALAGTGILAVTHDVTLLPALGEVPLTVLGLEAGRTAFCLDANDPALAASLGELLHLRLSAVEVDGATRLVITGRR